ncbi:GerMN domain-containing protein [Cryptosporangium phraense]|uniref:GerMN domain-containing protein n=1 Tax=Cryptosporangium phraense TaxID=2593070 RepID=A0A545ATP7_9ACTN|nr:GerMN domain-containing protein [Cryptosporangium phraense]TQS44708.1 GerMN domain-containing protein [Cryptosporangium phraense]
MRARAAAAALLSALGLLTACGIPLDDAPRPAGATADAGPAADVPAGTASERICLVRDGKLTPVSRPVRPPLAVAGHLDLLLDGPTRDEQNRGYRSALAGTTLVTGAAQAGGLVTVETGAVDAQPGRTDDVLAFGQVVCTLGSRLPVGTVVFVHDGNRVRVPRGDGSLSSGPLTIADYAELLAEE